MNNKNISVGLIIVFLVAVGAYFYPKASNYVQGITSAGTGAYVNGTYNSSIVTSLLTGTSTSILNNSASDKAVIEFNSLCSGIGTSQSYALTGAQSGIASLTLQAATTSVANLGLQGNTNYLLNTTIGTTSNTGLYYISSSTEGVLYGYSRIWPANTYLTFNTNATNTASCTLNVETIQL